MMMRDEEVARRLQPHDSACLMRRKPMLRQCDCDWQERVHNTFIILRTIRVTERRACEDITREKGGARAADVIRDRDNDDDSR